jgi:hypothetical protein
MFDILQHRQFDGMDKNRPKNFWSESEFGKIGTRTALFTTLEYISVVTSAASFVTLK